MADEKPTKVEVTVEASDFWWVSALLIAFLITYGHPDLLDVLQEWCRRYLESRNG